LQSETGGDGRDTIPERWRGAVEARLGPDEAVIAWLATDLDERLHFADGLVALTDRRLLNFATEGPAREFGLDPKPLLQMRERGGVGTLELLGGERRLAHWRFTIGRVAAARKLVDRSNGQGGRDDESGPAATCPSCGADLPGGDPTESCPSCTPPTAIPSASLGRLARFTRPRAGMIVLGFGLTLASTAAGLVPPYLTMPLLDRVLIPRQNGLPVDFGLVRYYLIGLAASAVLAWLLSWARSYVIAWVSERISGDLRNETYEHLQRLSLEFFGGKRTGDLMSRIGSDTDRICNFLSVNLLDFASDILMIIGTAAILLSIDAHLAAATLAPFPVIAFLVHRVRGTLRRGFRRGSRAWAEMASVLADTIPGIRVVKAFAQEDREVERFRASNDHVLRANDKVNAVWAFFGPMVTLLTQAGLLIVWGYGAVRVSEDRITVGVLTAFVAYISRFYTRLESMSRMVSATQRAAASTHRVFEILDRAPSVPEPVRPVRPDRVFGAIEFRGVGFRHGSRQILSRIDLKIHQGEMIGLVGPSGAGKSTLVNLTCRFYDVAEGAILVDGVDVRSFPVSEYRRHIGLVLQEPFLFYGTVAENIAYGRPGASRAEVVAAARAARAHEFILRLADGYDSLVGERGQSLSGGERQRISIARALLIDPAILILDEATSSVDTETEREIQEALDNLIRGRTTIAIAHRLSTLRKADRLVVIEGGRIAEVGGHLDLLGAGGPYARLHRAQLDLARGGSAAIASVGVIDGEV